MKKKFIKMNTNHQYMSLGNIYNILKRCSKNAKNFSQVDFFSLIFNTNDVSITAVNNYLIGYRAINIEYKKLYYDFLNTEDYKDIIKGIISMLEDKIIKNDIDINTNELFNKTCIDLKELLNEDLFAKAKITNVDNLNNYELFTKCLLYAILDNKQPIYNEEIMLNLNDEDLKEYLKINLYEGINYASSLERLALLENKYACAELGSLYYDTDIKKSYNYYLQAAKKNHPKGCWMVANMLINNNVNVDNKYEIIDYYLNKAIKLGSIAALNTKGLCYLKGINNENNIDTNKALEYFTKASEYGYKYAYNNLGKYYENIDYDKAIKYYKISASLKDSWALNKIGEYYRKNNDLDSAIFCYKEALNVPKNEICYYAYYNLAKYYYIDRDLDKAKEYLKIASSGCVKEAKNILKNIK